MVTHYIYSAAAVAGMLVGHEVGATFDKIDEMYAHDLLATIINTK